jgi:hypothetical protein
MSTFKIRTIACSNCLMLHLRAGRPTAGRGVRQTPLLPRILRSRLNGTAPTSCARRRGVRCLAIKLPKLMFEGPSVCWPERPMLGTVPSASRTRGVVGDHSARHPSAASADAPLSFQTRRTAFLRELCVALSSVHKLPSACLPWAPGRQLVAGTSLRTGYQSAAARVFVCCRPCGSIPHPSRGHGFPGERASCGVTVSL